MNQRVNPEVLRKARHLVQVYDHIDRPFYKTSSIIVKMDQLITNEVLTFDIWAYKAISRYIKVVKPDVLIQSIVCVSAIIRPIKGKYINVLLKSNNYNNYNKIGSFIINSSGPLSINSASCVYDINQLAPPSGNVPIDLRRMTNQQYDYEMRHNVQEALDLKVIMPIYSNDNKGNLKYEIKYTGFNIAGTERIFPFICANAELNYKFTSIASVDCEVIFLTNAFNKQ